MADLSLDLGQWPGSMPPLSEVAGSGLPEQQAPSLNIAPSVVDNSALGAGIARSVNTLSLAPPSGPPVADRMQSDRDYLQSLPTMEKIGLALQSFKSGMDGTASPIDTLLLQRRAQRAESRAELANTMNMLTKGFEIVRKVPPGNQRNAVIAALSKDIGPVFGPLLAGIDTEHDNSLRSFAEVVTDKDAQRIIFNACADDPNQQACWMKSITNKEMSEQIYTRVDGKRIYQDAPDKPSLLTRVEAYADGLKAKSKAAKAADPNADIPTQFTIADLAKSKLFTQSELETISRNKKNEETFAPFGFKSSAVQQAGDIAAEQARVRVDNAPEKYDTGKTAHIPGKSGTFNARVSKMSGESGAIEIQQPDGSWVANPTARLISQPGVDKPPKPEADTAKIERDRILVKISRGGTVSTDEQKFLDAYAKTNPLTAMLAGVMGDAAGVAETGNAGPKLTTNDTKIIAARRKVEGMSKDQAMKADTATQRAWRTAGNKISTETAPPGVENSTKAGAPDIAARFASDPAMAGSKIGKTLPDGRREVMKNGKLVGYYH